VTTSEDHTAIVWTNPMTPAISEIRRYRKFSVMGRNKKTNSPKSSIPATDEEDK